MISRLRPYLPPLLLVVLTTLIFARLYLFPWDLDFVWHTRKAFELRDGFLLEELPHFLYHFSVLAVAEVFPGIPRLMAGGIPVLLAIYILSLTLYTLLQTHFKANTPGGKPYTAVFWVLILMIITPVLPLNFDSARFYLGYFHPTVYHNPTQNMMKIWVIPVSLFAWWALMAKEAPARQQMGYTALSALAITLMTLTKPSYTLILAPGVAVFAVYRLITGQAVGWWRVVFGVMIPAAGLLGWQYLMAFNAADASTDTQASGIAFGLFHVLELWSRPPVLVPLMFIFSTLFPLTVYGLYFRLARQDTYLNFSWLIFLGGAALAYGFYETGAREIHGNFFWSAYAGLFVVMVATVLFLIRHVPGVFMLRSIRQMRPRIHAIWFVLLLHMLAAVGYWLINLRFSLAYYQT